MEFNNKPYIERFQEMINDVLNQNHNMLYSVDINIINVLVTIGRFHAITILLIKAIVPFNACLVIV